MDYLISLIWLSRYLTRVGRIHRSGNKAQILTEIKGNVFHEFRVSKLQKLIQARLQVTGHLDLVNVAIDAGLVPTFAFGPV